jgi:hypothetical protein
MPAEGRPNGHATAPAPGRSERSSPCSTCRSARKATTCKKGATVGSCLPRFAAQQAPAAEPDAGLCSASAGEQQALRRQSVLLVRNSRRLDRRSPGFCSPPVAATSVVPCRRSVLVQRGSQIVSAETPLRATFNSSEDTVRVGIATSALASWHLAASGPNLKATVRGDSTAHRPGTCLRVEAHAQPHPPAPRSPPQARTVTRARVLRRKASVRISAAPLSRSLALSPRSKRAQPRRGTTAFVLAPAWAALSQGRLGSRQPRSRADDRPGLPCDLDVVGNHDARRKARREEHRPQSRRRSHQAADRSAERLRA